MEWTIDDKFRTDANADIVGFILKSKNLSAHDEVAEALTVSATGLKGVLRYCPDVHNYAYFVLHTSAGRIFAIAFGQSGLAYRIPDERAWEAFFEGCRACDEIGPGWIMVKPWGVLAPDASKWCAAAYRFALGEDAAGARQDL